MNEQRIREIAKQCSDFAEQIPYFRGIKDGLTWEATIMKARDLKFAELIVKECAHLVGGYIKENEFGPATDVKEAYEEITKHFGVEE